jgi:hypothetical protein
METPWVLDAVLATITIAVTRIGHLYAGAKFVADGVIGFAL